MLLTILTVILSVVDIVRGDASVANARRQIHRCFHNQPLTLAAAAVRVVTDNRIYRCDVFRDCEARNLL